MGSDHALAAESKSEAPWTRRMRMLRRTLFFGLVGPYFGGAIIFLIMGFIDVKSGSMGKAAAGIGTGIAMGFFAYPFSLMFGGIPALLTGGCVSWLMERRLYNLLAWKSGAIGAAATILCAAGLDAASGKKYGLYLIAVGALGGASGFLTVLLLMRANRNDVIASQQRFD